jgi:hypothetical protein
MWNPTIEFVLFVSPSKGQTTIEIYEAEGFTKMPPELAMYDVLVVLASLRNRFA